MVVHMLDSSQYETLGTYNDLYLADLLVLPGI
jgi:hypothetical protein